MNKIKLIAMIAALVATTGCSALTKKYTISGEFTLRESAIDGDAILRTEITCAGRGGYSDIRPGLQVLVKNGSGETLGISDLGVGDKTEFPTCKFPFKVTDLPRSDFYSIEVGRRGSLEYSFNDLKERDWIVNLEIYDRY
jgi:hypothetical protein